MPILDRPPPPAPRKLDPKNLQAERNKVFPHIPGDPVNVVGWLRSGGCTTGCGACCEAVLLPIATQHMGPDEGVEWVKWLEVHGISVIERGGVTWAFIPMPCKQLTEDKGCALHGTPEKPQMCQQYPTHPAALWNLSVCTYKFAPLLMPNRAQRRKAGREKK